MNNLEEDINPRKRKLKTLLEEVSNKSLNITQNIMDLQNKLLDKNDDYPNELRLRKKRKLENDSSSNKELWQEMNKDWNDLLPYNNKIMDLWDRKMKLVETHSMKKEKGKLDEHSILERLALIIDNPHRILNKMQSVDKLFRMYGDKEIKINNEGNIVENDEDEYINNKDQRIVNGIDIGRGNNKQLKFEKYRMEYQVFNDSQFYRRMLKEIIDIGHAATFNAEEIHRKMDNIQQEKQKQKIAFHKAKLRMKYTIRPDMENFMAPIYDHDPDFPVQQLYNSLFQ